LGLDVVRKRGLPEERTTGISEPDAAHTGFGGVARADVAWHAWHKFLDSGGDLVQGEEVHAGTELFV
jgi:hypothetical protein